uniref:Rho/Rac guanine nucleotide exchange factor 2 n=1 Tax=Homo sapiens TaxID=9606 RepID=A0A8Q3SIV8_HUMAN
MCCCCGCCPLLAHLEQGSLRERTREKEKMKEAKDARYTNGHLFTTISVSGMTMCYACNKSITAKEALICPTTESGPAEEQHRLAVRFSSK